MAGVGQAEVGPAVGWQARANKRFAAQLGSWPAATDDAERTVKNLAYARCDDGATWRWRLPGYSEVAVLSGFASEASDDETDDADARSTAEQRGRRGNGAVHAGASVLGPAAQPTSTAALRFRPMMVLDFEPFDVSGAVTCLGQICDPADGVGFDPDLVVDAEGMSPEERVWHGRVLLHSPPFCGSTVCVGFEDGSILVFRESSKSYSAHALTNPDAFRYLGTLVNPDPEWAALESRGVTSLSLSRPDHHGPTRVLATYTGWHRAVEFELPAGVSGWEASAVAEDSLHPRAWNIGRPLQWWETRHQLKSFIRFAEYNHDGSEVVFCYDDFTYGGTVNVWERATQGISEVAVLTMAPTTARFVRHAHGAQCGGDANGASPSTSGVSAGGGTDARGQGNDHPHEGPTMVLVGGQDGVLRTYERLGPPSHPHPHPDTHSHGHEHSHDHGAHEGHEQSPVNARDRGAGKAKEWRLVWDTSCHVQAVTHCVITPDGDTAISAASDGPIRMFASGSGELLARTTMQRHCGVSWVEPSPDGLSCVVCSADTGTIKLVCTQSGLLYGESTDVALDGDGGFNAACYVAGGKGVVAGGAAGTLSFFDVGRPEAYESAALESAIFCADVDAEGAVVASGDSDDVKFFDAGTGQFLFSESLDQPIGWIAFSRASVEYVAVGCLRTQALRGRVRVYKYAYPEMGGHHGHQYFEMGQFDDGYYREIELPRHHCHRAEFHPTRNDRLLVVAHTNKTVIQADIGASYSDRVGQILYLDVDTTTVLWAIDSVPDAPLYWPTNAAFSASGAHFVLAARDVDGKCTVRVFGTEQGELRTTHVVAKGRAADRESGRAMPMHVSWSSAMHDDALGGTVSRITVAWSAWDAADDEVNEVAIFPMRQVLGDHGIEHEFAGHELLGEHEGRITSCDFSPDGTLLVTSTREGTLRLFSVAVRSILYCTSLPTDFYNTARFFHKCPSGPGGSGAAVVTSSPGGRWRIYDHDNFFRSAIVLTATLALQGNSAIGGDSGGRNGSSGGKSSNDVALGRPRILRDTLKLLGSQVFDFVTTTHGTLADVLLFKRKRHCGHGGRGKHATRGEVGAPVYAVRPHVVPESVMLAGSSSQALFRLFREWPHREPASVYLALHQPHRLSIIDIALEMPISQEPLALLAAIILHLDVSVAPPTDGSAHHAYFALTRAIPRMLFKYPDLAKLALDMQVRDTPGCADLRFVDTNEAQLTGVSVICTGSPRWSKANARAWSPLLLPSATSVLKPQQQVRGVSDLSKFGMAPQVIPLPGVQLLWYATSKAFHEKPELSDLFFQTKIMVAVLEYEWLQTRWRFATIVAVYLICAGLTTAVCLHYARGNFVDLFKSDGDRLAAAVACGLNGFFLAYEVAKLRLGFPQHLSTLVSGFLGHVSFFAASAAVVWGTEDSGMHRALSAITITLLFIKLLQYGRVSERFSGPVQLLNLYMRSIASFVAMMVVLFVGFAFSLMALHAQRAAPWVNFWEAQLSLLYLLIGEIHPVYVRGVGDFDDGPDTWVADDNSTYVTQAIIVGLFIFIGSVFLLNVLVAVLNIEYSKLSSSARWRSEQAAAILELQLWELLVDDRAKWLYNGAGPQPYSPLQLGVAYDNPTMRWLLDVDERAAGRYWMHVMPPDDDPFWSTVLTQPKSAEAVYEKVQDIRALVLGARTLSR